MKYKTFYGESEVLFYVEEESPLSISLIDFDEEYPEPYCDVTVRIPGAPACREDEAYVKEWSENAGLGDWLVENGIATRTGISARTGYVTAYQYKFDMDKVRENSWNPEKEEDEEEEKGFFR